jgi:dynein heavy chain
MYLEPIFASDDIKKKLPQEKNRFDSIDFSWRQTLAKFNQERNMWEGIESDRLLSDFKRDSLTLDKI